jgi:hypothetical protein
MGFAFLLLHFAVVVAAALIRYDDSWLGFLGPVQLGRTGWGVVAGASAGLAVVLLVACGRSVWPNRERRRAALELLIVPAAWGYVWLCLPPRTREYSVDNWLALGAVVCFAAWCVLRGRETAKELGLTRERFKDASRVMAIPTILIFVVLMGCALLIFKDEVRWGRLVLHLLTYPLYAMAQLLVLEVFFVVRLRRLGASTAEAVAAGAGMFALAHWPNGVVMIVCLLGAAFWTWVYLARPNLYAVALSMGVVAGTFTAAIPSRHIDHMRTGPMHVYRRGRAAQKEAARRPRDGER